MKKRLTKGVDGLEKIVFFDVDGTLLAKNGKIPTSTQQAIAKLKEEGVLPVIATGRSPLLLEGVAQALDIDSYIAMNGQYIVLEGELFYHNPIAPDLLDRFTQYAKEAGDGYVLCGSDEIYTGTSMDKESKRYRFLKYLASIVPQNLQLSFMKRAMKKYPDPLAYQDKPVYQAILQAPANSEINYIENFPGLRFTRSNPIMFDVIKNGTSKATGIQRIADHYQVDLDQTYAFGDHLNDIEMLQVVGHGVAMGNALDEVKSISDRVTLAVDQGGIYHGLLDLGIIDPL